MVMRRVMVHLGSIDDINVNRAEYKERLIRDIKKETDRIMPGAKPLTLTDKERKLLLRLVGKVRANSSDKGFKYWESSEYKELTKK